MQVAKLFSSENKNLILFFGGFASNPSHFKHLKADNINVIMLYDYRYMGDLEGILCDIRKQYQHITMLAFSLGVSVASAFKYQYEKNIAINGTVLGISEKCGIHPKIYERTVRHFRVKDFASAMFGRECDAHFETESALIEELKSLQTFILAKGEKSQILWDKAVIALEDKIFPVNALKAHWEGYFAQSQQNIIYQQGAHFIFENFSAWEELCRL